MNPEYHEDFGQYQIDVEPFTKLNWKSAESRDVWRKRFSGMSRAKDEAEWLSVLDDETERKAAIIHVTNQNREKWLRRVGEYGLSYRDIRYSRQYDGFSHEFLPTDKSNPNRLTYAVIAENPDVADKMEEAETEMSGEERHRTVGELLGFPDCCQDFFANTWLGEKDVHIRDPMYEVSCNSDCATAVDGDNNNILLEDPNPGACVMWRYFGLSYITHIPCSWDCEESIEIARQRYRIMTENGYQEEADWLNEWLSQPFTWSGYHGIAHIQNSHVTASSNTANYLDEKNITWKGDYEILS